MIIKVVIDYKHLAALHEALKSPDNQWEAEHYYRHALVNIRSVKSVEDDRRGPVPPYEVVLGVDERLTGEVDAGPLVPLSRLSRILAAMGLFPEDQGVPRAG